MMRNKYPFERKFDEVKSKIKSAEVYHAPFDSLMGVPYRFKNGSTFITPTAYEVESGRKYTIDEANDHQLWVYDPTAERSIKEYNWTHKATAESRGWTNHDQVNMHEGTMKAPKHVNLK